jgi:Flp pilus assembly protein TadD
MPDAPHTDEPGARAAVAVGGTGVRPGFVRGALLVGLTFVSYLPALFARWIWDDDAYVTDNPTLLDAAGLLALWTDLTATPQYYPLVFSTFWVEQQVWGLWPMGFHLVNVGLHALLAVLLWRLLAGRGVPGAWLAAMLFALHPVHVESVAWVTERKNVLSGVFALGAATLLVPWLLDASRRQGWRYGVGAALFVCALLSKTVTASLPAALLLVVYLERGRLDRRSVLAMVPLLIVGAGAGLLTATLEVTHVGSVEGGWIRSWGEHIIVAGRVPWFYLGKLLLPVNLAFIYERWALDDGSLVQYLPAVGAAVLVAVLVVRRDKLGRGPVVALLFFGGTLFPVLGFLSVWPMRYAFVADHFQYLASIGPLALLAAGLHRLLSPRPRMQQRLFAGLLAAVLMTLTSQRTSAFEDEETLFKDTLAKNPTCWMCANNLGVAHKRRGELEQAEALFMRSIAQHPENTEAHYNLAKLRSRQNRHDEAFAILEHAATLPVGSADVLVDLAIHDGRRGRFAEAEVNLRAALARKADHALGNHFLGKALIAQGREAEALRAFEAAAAADASYVAPRVELAWYLATGPDSIVDGPRAVRWAEDALQLSQRRTPRVIDALGAAYAAAGRFDDAQAAARRAERLARRAGRPAEAEAIAQRRAGYAKGERYRR